MPATISPLAVRRSIWIAASPTRVWQEFESFERMAAWFGTGHTLTTYEPGPNGRVEFDAGAAPDDERLVFGGRIVVWEPAKEVTWESDWVGHGWRAAPLITIRLRSLEGGTLVELFSHSLERTGEGPGILNGLEGGWTTRQLEALRAILEA